MERFNDRPDLPVLVIWRWQQRLQDFHKRHTRATRHADVDVPDLTAMWYAILEQSWTAPLLPAHLQGAAKSAPASDVTVSTATTATSSLASTAHALPEGYKLVPVGTEDPPAKRTGGTLNSR